MGARGREGGWGNKRDDRRERNGDKIGRKGCWDAHLLILQAPQAENCSRDVFGFCSCFWARREAEEEEPSEGEPELCLIGIIVKKREERKGKKENGRCEKGVGHCEVKRTPLCIQPRP